MSKTIGVDVGGTFTDVISFDDVTSQLIIRKVPSTLADQSIGFMRGLAEVGLAPSEAAVVLHGTTVATNAVIERKGAACGLITTRGFRDVIELRRRDRRHVYGLMGDFEPLVPRNLRCEISERLDASGNVVAPVNEIEVREAAKHLRRCGVESVAVCLLHSFANPAHEQVVRRVLEEVWPNRHITLSSEVLREYGEFERSSTTVVNAYVQPIMSKYLGSLNEKLQAGGYNSQVLILQGNGGVMSLENASRMAVNTVGSGPAGGVVAATALAGLAGHTNLISCDMGGTSVDICVVQGKAPMRTRTNIDYGIPMQLPTMDVESVGAGGGSIAWIDRGGILRIGPMSTGADPGPACYGRGGKEPTVTDANLVLGRIPQVLARMGSVKLDLDRGLAREAIRRSIADPLGLSVERAAFAILEVTNNKIAGSIRSVTTLRGRDPRQFALVPFGGAGPLQAMAVMRILHMPTAVVPFAPGVTSALGCVMADHRHEMVQTVNRVLPELDFGMIGRMLAEHRKTGLDLLVREGCDAAQAAVLHYADVSYAGQTHTIRISLQPDALNLQRVTATFEDDYRERYGNLVENTLIFLSNVRTSVVGVRAKPDLLRRGSPPAAAAARSAVASARRDVYFGDGFVDCPIYEPGDPATESAGITGPAVIELPDCTVLVEPGGVATAHPWGYLLVQGN